MNEFRIASRELFNHYFRIPNPYDDADHAWDQEERFQAVQALLFQKLVSEPLNLPAADYGNPQPTMLVEKAGGTRLPVMLNREVDSGYWDFPLTEVGPDTLLLFMCFFDWDHLEYRDNRFVRVLVDRWPAHPEAVGKHGLIESNHVRFIKG